MVRKKKKITHKQTKQPESLDELYILFKGRGGGPEAESIISDSKLDPDTVNVWSCKHDIAKLIERCRKNIVSYYVTFGPHGELIGCQLEIKRKAFRGIFCAFRNTK